MRKTSVQSAVAELTKPTVSVSDGITETWEELNEIKDTIANGVLEFVGSGEIIRQTPEITQSLGDKTAEFEKLLNLFYTDIDQFTKRMQTLIAEHDGKTGVLTTIEELHLFSSLSAQYLSLGDQLTVLIGPTVGQLMLLINDAVPVSNQESGEQHV